MSTSGSIVLWFFFWWILIPAYLLYAVAWVALVGVVNLVFVMVWAGQELVVPACSWIGRSVIVPLVAVTVREVREHRPRRQLGPPT